MQSPYYPNDENLLQALKNKIDTIIAANDPAIIAVATKNTTRTCKVCGCSDLDACCHEEHGNCWWVAPDLCSHCKIWPGEATRYSLLNLLNTSK